MVIRKRVRMLLISCISVICILTCWKSRISENEAIEIAERYWNIQDDEIDEVTDFPKAVFLWWKPSESREYIASLEWLVDSGHWSVLDIICIDAETGECRSYYDTMK